MYATVEQANTYISNYYSSTDPIRQSWEALSVDNKQVQLNRAEKLIDQLPFNGEGMVPGKAFPREPQEDISLAKAEEATIEVAAQTLVESDVQLRLALQAQNVKSYKIGDLTETFGEVSVDPGVNRYILSIVFPILRQWLGGGYNICPTRVHR